MRHLLIVLYILSLLAIPFSGRAVGHTHSPAISGHPLSDPTTPLGGGIGDSIDDATKDSIKGKATVLTTVVISGNRIPSAALSQAPVQVVDAEKMERLGVTLLSEAMRQMAGVTLKDYGGVGGMKTVSARGLGSQFSTLTIDGVPVNDCQNGQVDLGRYLVGNSAFISFSNGQQEEMLLTARSTAAGSIINMETLEPHFMPGQRTHLHLGMEGGSFGLLSPTLQWEQRLGPRMSLTAWGNYLTSRGDYPFTLYYTLSHDDSSSVERREHSATRLATGDINLFYTLNSHSSITAKTHYVRGYHELPGPVQYYNVEKGSEQTREALFFTQVKYRNMLPRFSFQLIGKYQRSYDLYEDFDANTASRYMQNDYLQHEGYLSGALQWKPVKGLSASLSADEALTTLQSNLSRNNEVRRLTTLGVAAVQYKNSRITLKGNLLGTLVDEQACDVEGTIRYRRLSPYAGVSLKPFAGSDLRVRYFFKETYRVPNFNEMYYFTLPRELRPERAEQHNIGLTIPLQASRSVAEDDTTGRALWLYALTVDGYRNRVTDKIVAVPTQSMFLWSMQNLGLVGITGLDVTANAEWQRRNMSISATLTYTYQKAVDLTDPTQRIYGHQIRYTPRHSGGATLYWQNPWVNVGCNLLLVGVRYYGAQNSDATKLPAYGDLGITLDHTFELPVGDLRLQAQLLNVCDVQYEVVRSYPMMGRNFRLRLNYEF